MSEERFVSPYYQAIILIGLDEFDRAFEFLEKAYEIRESMLMWIKIFQLYDSIRPDPRFKALLKKMRLDD